MLRKQGTANDLYVSSLVVYVLAAESAIDKFTVPLPYQLKSAVQDLWALAFDGTCRRWRLIFFKFFFKIS